MTVLSIVGARPQFVKAAPVSRRLRERGEEVLVHTGQHYDEELSDVFFDQLAIPEPDHHLGVGSGSHADQTAAMLRKLDAVIEREDPEVVLVYGDTNSTLAGALAASKRPIALAHVEAGLRSGDWSMPEEVNRVLTDHAADLLFVPSERAAGTLRGEGVDDGVHVVGDVMYDALRAARDRVDAAAALSELDVDAVSGEFVLATVHRAANTDDPGRLRSVVEGLAAAPWPVVFPAHPRTVEALERHGLDGRAREHLQVIEPVGYLEFLGLVEAARVVATDSGGVQKEAFYLDTPCVTLRDETEWVETVEAGWNRLVGPDPWEIATALSTPETPAEKPALYGDGTAATRIAEVLDSALAGRPEGVSP